MDIRVIYGSKSSKLVYFAQDFTQFSSFIVLRKNLIKEYLF